eukprot:1526353-Prymnesium_polylepis.3
MIEARAVIVVERLAPAVVGKNEVACGERRHRRKARFASKIRQEGQAIPAVYRSVVSALATRVPDAVAVDEVASSKAIIEVDSGTRQVESDIVPKCRLACLGLAPRTRLLLVQANLSNEVAFDDAATRLVAARGVEVLRIAPRCHCAVTNPRKRASLDADAPCEAGEQDAVAIKPQECAARDGRGHGALKMDRRTAVQRPISTTRHAPWLHECLTRVTEVDVIDSHPHYRLVLRARGANQRLQLCRDEVARWPSGSIGCVWPEVERLARAVEIELGGRVELLKDAIDIPAAAPERLAITSARRQMVLGVLALPVAPTLPAASAEG